jgi:glycosyltransferase involved in cell wall biosynthesis
MTPWLSVILPVRNGEPYLTEALESIAIQDLEGVEVLAVEDGSTDSTVQILRSYASRIPLRILQPAGIRNYVQKLNVGTSEARGEYLTLLCHDDGWQPHRLRTLRPWVQGPRAPAFLIHSLWYVDARHRRLGPYQPPLPPDRDLPSDFVVERLLVQNWVGGPATLFRRDLTLRVGSYDEDLWYSADWDLYLKIAALGSTRFISRALAFYRLHSQSMSSLRSREATGFRQQHDRVLNRHVEAWSRTHPGSCRIEPLARFSIEVNTTLAALAYRQKVSLGPLLLKGARLGPAGAFRYLRYSRLAERLGARLRGRLWMNSR